MAPGAHQAIFRAAQEALANVGRHARAGNVLVAVDSSGGRFVFRIQDDGVGFDPNQDPRGMGLANMRDRAKEFGGDIEVASRPGAGAAITFSVPYAIRTAGEYRCRALFWGATLIVQVALSLRMKSLLIASVAVISVIGLAREANAWRRTRKRAEAAG